MNDLARVLLIVLAVALAAGSGWLWLGASQFTSRVAELNARLAASQPAAAVAVDIATLPGPVREFALRNGGRVGAAGLLMATQEAEMRLGPDQPFFAMTATQLSGTRRPGFVWHAHGTMIGIIPVTVVDAYVKGAGLLEARIGGAIPVARSSGPDTDRGEAMRFLAELPFNPDAILNAAELHWQQNDASTVTVWMDTAGGPARVQLMFGAGGDIVAVKAPDRPRMVGDRVVPTSWIGRYGDYGPVGTYRLPRSGEVAWLLPNGEFVYWRGAMTHLAPAP